LVILVKVVARLLSKTTHHTLMPIVLHIQLTTHQ
jgi:hypothetical protein